MNGAVASSVAAAPSVVASSAASEAGSGGGGGRRSPANGAEEVTPLVQVFNILEKKVRNLDKRKTKLDGLKASKTKLEVEQQKALAKYDDVISVLESFRDIKTQVNKLVKDEAKNKKKQEKRELIERSKAEAMKIGYVVKVQHLFHLLLEPSGEQLVEELAPQLKGSQLDLLLKFAQLVSIVSPSGDDAGMDEQALCISSHLINLADKKETAIGELKVTYKVLADTIDILVEAGILAPAKQQEPDVPENQGEEEDAQDNGSDVDVVGEEEEEEVVQTPINQSNSHQAPAQDRPQQQPQTDNTTARQQRQPQQHNNNRHTAPVNGHIQEDEHETQHRLGHAQEPQAPTYPNHHAHAKENTPPAAVQPHVEASQLQVAAPAKQPTPEPSFNFLQESQIDLDSPLMNDPAVVMVQGGRKPDQGFPPPPVFNAHGGAHHSALSQQFIQQHSAALMAAAHQQQLQQQQGGTVPQHQQNSQIQNVQPQLHSQQQNYIQPSTDTQQQQRLAQAQQQPREQQQLPRVPQPGTVNYTQQQQQQQQQEHDNSSRYSQQQETIRYNSSKDHNAATPQQHQEEPKQQQQQQQPHKNHEEEQHGYNATPYTQQQQNGAEPDTEIGTWGEEEGAGGAGDNASHGGQNDRRRDDRGGRGGPRGGGGRGYSRGDRGGGRGYSRGRGGGGGERGGYRGGRGGGEGGREFRGEREFRGGDREFNRGGGEQRSSDYNRGGERGGDYKAGGEREFRGGRGGGGGGEREYRGGERGDHRGGEYRGGERPRGNRGYGGRGRGGPRGGGGEHRGAGGPRE